MENDDAQKQIERIARTMASAFGLDLWGVQYKPSGKRGVVRVFLDKPGEGEVDVDECAQVSRHMSVALDAEDIVPGRYTLEVSSPGLERLFFSLGQLAGYEGRKIAVVTKTPLFEADFPGRKRFIGVLVEVVDSGIRLDPGDGGDPLEFPWTEIETTRLVHEFDEKAKTAKK
ncbi:ribosome maturation factor RimP [Oceanidesulfovibrio indonesiensis]|uniref:Ribosome maturation factor RimP n=1 Tax=Oceanidesulfovibrio indonesiensis TaxID=54767 RepID=A0A7M3MHD3_9BACT|nr:ribosome maturation factor RimP [Oceanidesulfovibrio indonesiensis]TVM18832.1 ribosome maturation factor RimP [Oceanidesulfovibrio indonesiensis]